MTNTIATIGYEKTDLQHFTQSLREAGIKTLVDIRSVPFSHKRGFSQAPLREAMTAAGIGYWHLKELGNSKEGRIAAGRGDSARFGAIYQDILSGPAGRSALGRVAERAGDERICLMCFEREHASCHRGFVAQSLQTEGFSVDHLIPLRTVALSPRERQGLLL